jgi:hypothetical protein
LEHTWGLLGPEFLPDARRNRSLGLGASVRLFNDLAVPGLGGVWYGKQLLLSTLGIVVAEGVRRSGASVQNAEMANAIEALACWLSFESNGWRGDARLRGKVKLQDKNDLSFRQVRQRNFYVTQPMRTATVQALPALGFVDTNSARFNAFRLTDAGRLFVDEATRSYRPFNAAVIGILIDWVLDNKLKESPKLSAALSPLVSLSDDAMLLLQERLIQGGVEPIEDKKRRRGALDWVEALRKDKLQKPTWEQRPKELAESHWLDIRAGALFFELRDVAIELLDKTEAHIGNLSTGQSLALKKQVPEFLAPTFEKLKSAAKKFAEVMHSDEEANKFCRDCLIDEFSSNFGALVARDQRVLRLVGDEIKPGPAYRATQQALTSEVDEQPAQASDIPLPPGISYRLQNLYLLNLDMHGELTGWLKPSSGGNGS